MSDTMKKCFFYLGIFAAIFICVFYILPLVLKLLGVVLKGVFFILIAAAIGFAIFIIVTYITKLIREKK